MKKFYYHRINDKMPPKPLNLQYSKETLNLIYLLSNIISSFTFLEPLQFLHNSTFLFQTKHQSVWFLTSKGSTQLFDQVYLLLYGRFKVCNTIYTFALCSIYSSYAILLLSFRRIFALLLRSWYVFTSVLPRCFVFQERYAWK